jgi:hypothetical protein
VAVRDGLTAFQGAGDYVHAQLDPERQRARLRPAGQMVASEGVVAAALFALASRRALDLGARPTGGLQQPGVLQAELELALALREACDRAGGSASIRDLVDAYRRQAPWAAALGRDAWLDVTHDATADPAAASAWQGLYEVSLALDIPAIKRELGATLARRRALRARIDADGAQLWRQLGPVVPVRAGEARFALMGDSGGIAFDLNAAGEAELASVPGLAADARRAILDELARRPFESLEDLRARIAPRTPGQLAPVGG